MADRDPTDPQALEQIRSLARFPDENPNPVMRIGNDGLIIYANPPSARLLAHWETSLGGPLPPALAHELTVANDTGAVRELEVDCGEIIYAVVLTPIPDVDYANLYARDITAQRAAEQRALDMAHGARDEAVQASQAKSSFLANMSHELRTPMNAIIGYSEMLLEEAQDAGLEDFIPDLQRIHGAGKHLLALINDILDLSKIEAGRMSIFVEEVRVGEVVDLVSQTVAPLVSKNRNRLDCRVDTPDVMMRTDVTKVRQILFNLLSNACKFTSDGTVSLTLTAADSDGTAGIRVTVTDTGIGMTQEQANRIFDSFVQADDSTSRSFGGTGLGLAITRRFSEMLGGRIGVTSAPGKGTTFEVWLPLITVQDSGADQALVLPGRPESTFDSCVAGRPVLVIDDDPTVRDIVSTTLRKAGFAVVTAANGEEGLQMARTLQPVAITLDVIMPGMDGWAVLSALKSDPVTRDTPVVLATISDDRNLGFALGAAEFMTKPVDRKRLVQLIQSFHDDSGDCELLIVDDDSENREILRKSLEKIGWTTVAAANGRAGLEELERSTPDLVILDLMMPVMNGFQFLQAIRADERWRGLPVIVVTARELSPEERDFLRGTVESVLQKGATPRDQLLAHVREVIKSSVAHRPEQD